MSGFASTKESGAPGSRRNWMETERQLACYCDSDSEDGTVCNPRRDFNTCEPLRRLRTHIDYDHILCHPGYNLRCVKWGPKGGVWEHHWTPMVAQGPPNENLRKSERYCWLCDAALDEHKRTWTRPEWKNRLAGPGFRFRMSA